jgi:GTP1/Obg family GTP-binding protein
MSEQARISSIDALEAFRGDLVRYVEAARIALDDMTGGARRTRTWLDVDRTQHWMGLHKKAVRLLRQAEQELYSANLTNPDGANPIQKMAVTRAERKVAEIEEKLRVLKRWRQVFDNRSGPLLHQLEPMYAQTAQSLPKAIHLLGEYVKALQAYSGGQGAAP